MENICKQIWEAEQEPYDGLVRANALLTCFSLPNHIPDVDLIDAVSYIDLFADKKLLDGENLHLFYQYIINYFERRSLNLFSEEASIMVGAYCTACSAVDVFNTDQNLFKKKRFAKIVCLNLLLKDFTRNPFIEKVQKLSERFEDKTSQNAHLLNLILQVAGHLGVIKVEHEPIDESIVTNLQQEFEAISFLPAVYKCLFNDASVAELSKCVATIENFEA